MELAAGNNTGIVNSRASLFLEFYIKEIIMMKKILLGLILPVTFLILAACGNSDNSATPAKTSVTVNISLNGTLGSNAIAGVGFSVTLPANVTPEMAGSVVATTVVTPSGIFAGSTIAPVVTYTPAAGASPGSLQIIIASSEAAGATTTGEIVTITLHLANGSAPVASDIITTVISVTDTLGAPISGLSTSVSNILLQ